MKLERFPLTINSLSRFSIPYVRLKGFKRAQNSVMIGSVVNRYEY